MTRTDLIDTTAETPHRLNVEIQAAIIDRRPGEAADYAEALRETAIAYRELTDDRDD